MLGIDLPAIRDPIPYRDYFAAGKDDPEMKGLEDIGAVELYAESEHYSWYRTTKEGRDEAIASHQAIRLPKSKRMYRKFLKISDLDSELTFREFITSPYYSDARNGV